MSTLQRTLIWIAGLALLAGLRRRWDRAAFCRGTGTARAKTDGPSARFTVTIAIPAKTGKVAHYVSASTQSIAITVVPSAGGALQTFYRTLGKKVGYCKPKGAFDRVYREARAYHRQIQCRIHDVRRAGIVAVSRPVRSFRPTATFPIKLPAFRVSRST